MKRINQVERTDRDITNAVLKIMEEKNFEKITVQDILDEALINRSTFYQHFPDKYAVLERLQRKFITGMTQRIDKITVSGEWDMGQINEVIFEYLLQNRKQMRQILEVRSKNLNLDEQMRDMFAGYLRQSSGSLGTLEIDLLAGMMVSFFVDCLKHEISERDFVQTMMDSYLNMTLFFFRVDKLPSAKERFMSLVGELHREQKQI